MEKTRMLSKKYICRPEKMEKKLECSPISKLLILYKIPLVAKMLLIFSNFILLTACPKCVADIKLFSPKSTLL